MMGLHLDAYAVAVDMVDGGGGEISNGSESGWMMYLLYLRMVELRLHWERAIPGEGEQKAG
jgi:hypothetical protein